MSSGCKEEKSAIVRHVCRTPEEKYECCELLNIIQHIDIYDRHRTISNERRGITYRPDPVSLSAISLTSPKQLELLHSETSETSMKNIESKLSRFTVTTKVSGLYPGHDMLSKQARRNRLEQIRKTAILPNFVPKR